MVHPIDRECRYDNSDLYYCQDIQFYPARYDAWCNKMIVQAIKFSDTGEK